MKKVTSIVIGAGLRGGHVYSQYALDHPDEFQVVAVAEPDKERRESFAKRHNIPEELCFESYEELLGKEKLADCAMICTMDRMHYEPTIMALKKGYHVLCEKPMSPDKKEIIEMGEMAKKYDRILSVCHVLRYSPFFSKLKELLEEGKIGRLMTIQHMEEVGYWHQAHSFVRGNWRNAEESSPMILQKCCHDMDIMLWLADSKCESLSSFGELSYFTEENAPEGAPAYCLDGCPHRDECAFYAPRFYLENLDGYLVRAVTDQTDPEHVLEALKKGPYGMSIFAGPKLRYLWGKHNEITFKNFDQKGIHEKLYPFNVSAVIGVGVNISRIFFDFRYEQGIGNISKSIIYDNINSDGSTGVSNIIFRRRDSALSFSLGFIL